MATTTEVERKYEVPADFTVPDLSRLPAVASVDAPAEHRLDATYYDTADLRLAANRVTLRRRTGGHDAGWHIKRPSGGDRSETQLPDDGAGTGIPAEVSAEVRDLTGGAELTPVAHIRTRRLEQPLRGPDGLVLALVADDTVSTEALGDPPLVQRWREVEVELAGGPRDLLDEVDATLRAAGAQPSAAPSKLARALGARYPGASGSGDGQRSGDAEPGAEPDGDDGAAAALGDYLRAQRDAIHANEVGVRAGDADAVHDMRVAIRRLRSTLRTFRPLLAASRTEPVRAELRWLAGLLGAVRDGDVLADRLTGALAAVPPDDVVGPVPERLHERLTARTDAARVELLAALDATRYRDLLTAVDALVDDAWSAPPGRRDVLRRVRRTLRGADRRLAGARTDEAGRDVALHEARKAYKRARYGVEAVAPFDRSAAHRLTRALTRLQDVLGTHQDAIVAGQVVRELAEAADRAGESAFSYGLLRERQRVAGDQALRGLPAAARRATRKKTRRWLRT